MAYVDAGTRVVPGSRRWGWPFLNFFRTSLYTSHPRPYDTCPTAYAPYRQVRFSPVVVREGCMPLRVPHRPMPMPTPYAPHRGGGLAGHRVIPGCR